MFVALMAVDFLEHRFVCDGVVVECGRSMLPDAVAVECLEVPPKRETIRWRRFTDILLNVKKSSRWSPR